MRKILIVGAFGYGNLGDDAIRDAEVQYFKSKGYDVSTSSPPLDRNVFKGVWGVVVGGGGIIYDRDYPNVNNYLDYIKVANEYGKRVVVCNVGTQGIITEEGKREYKEWLNRVNAISVRDPTDKAILENIGVNNNIFVAEDSAWMLNYFESESQNDVKEIAQRIGFAVRRKRDIKYTHVITELIKSYNVHPYCFSSVDDESWLKSFSVPVCASRIQDLKMSCQFMVVSRFHALVSAISLGITPIIVCSKNTKIGRFVNRFEFKNVAYIDEDNFETTIRSLVETPLTESKHYLQTIYIQCKRKAEKGLVYIDSFLGGKT